MFWRARSGDAGNWWLTIVGRLKPGTPLAQAQAAVSGLFRNEMLHGAVPLFHDGESAVRPGGPVERGPHRDQMFHGAMPLPTGGNGPASKLAPLQQTPGGSVQVRGDAPDGPTPHSTGNAPFIRRVPPGAAPEGWPEDIIQGC